MNVALDRVGRGDENLRDLAADDGRLGGGDGRLQMVFLGASDSRPGAVMSRDFSDRTGCTYNLFALLHARVDLWDIPLLVIFDLFDLVLTEDL